MSRKQPRERGGSPRKQSYESSPDVQRWLRRQQVQHGVGELEFEPTFLAGRRDSDWVRSALEVFYQRGLIADVVSQASSGKEATVYRCVGGPAADAEWLAAKVYRPRMFRSLKNDAVYRQGRVARDAEGKVAGGRRARLPGGQRGREALVNNWIAQEYVVQEALFAAGADVPRPYAHIGNAILMEWVGDDDGPAPRLSDVTLDRDEAGLMFARMVENIGIMLACHTIHGDLSAYNLLYHADGAVVIDLAQAVDPRYSADAYELLERDVERVCRYFARAGVAADAAAIAGELWATYVMGGRACR